MRCLSLRRDVNSNDNGTDKREALREGKPSAEQMQGRALPPRESHCTFDDGSPVSKVLRGYS